MWKEKREKKGIDIVASWLCHRVLCYATKSLHCRETLLCYRLEMKEDKQVDIETDVSLASASLVTLCPGLASVNMGFPDSRFSFGTPPPKFQWRRHVVSWLENTYVCVHIRTVSLRQKGTQPSAVWNDGVLSSPIIIMFRCARTALITIVRLCGGRLLGCDAVQSTRWALPPSYTPMCIIFWRGSWNQNSGPKGTASKRVVCVTWKK
jgi:hypothetical protein